MKPRFWFVIAAMAAALALIIALVSIFSTGTGPRSYVAKNYTRAAHLDIRGDDDNRAYTSRKAPSVVSREITSAWDPIAQRVEGSGVYLRYADDGVIIQPRRDGSVIHVMEIDEAYRHYHGVVAGFWGWSSPRGEDFRGRGPGSGK
ncbi:uncharacterized protein DUF4247 [Halopolyspora algeriensis]|uniref:Uncharacterized protein DUF4247 n=1 Tax=Halopolyspora algeriensis TaxID=1500506 RepID=A0A368VM76_9ACTN|nr:DUF4247 domain-containing protein [Halopolyspora algeriensis]RCW40130.1 uncharacterized protein DUF4247 [Halopolyspora algeriensis]TQM46387.1 uncharacterized protein DUF4247 [Halopolyspora algeriensis]